MNSMDAYTKIRADLKKLSKSKAVIFGSEAHRFRLNPKVPEKELHSFEHKYGVQLPADYRMFLKHVGRGGAGPYYGLFDFHQMDYGYEHKPWSQSDGFVGILSNPFPYTDPWNDLTGRPDEEIIDRDEDEYWRHLAMYEERYFTPLDGAIPICHLGCALRHWLVISGSETGNVWADHRADDNGLAPVTLPGGDRVTFFTWYRDWLDKALVEIR